MWFFGGPVLDFAREFLCEVSSHQKDTCAKQEGGRALPGAHLKPDARKWREVSLPVGSPPEL